MLGTPSKSLAAATLLLSCFLPGTSAFWRLPCDNPVLIERADPIVNPGVVSGHLHTIMGGNGFDFSMDFKKARSSTCSSCTVTQDLSNYWIPALFYAAKNGTFHPVKQVGGALIYYLQRRGDDKTEKLHAFPEGFQMLAGDPFLRSYSDTPAQNAISYACIDYSGNGGPETHGFPTKNCPQGLRLQVFFPSCWNGKDLDSPDHKSHMAYPDGVNTGNCPPTHPVRFISIFYEVLYSVDEWKDQWYDGKQPFVLANGDPTGYGLHGDFVNGWDVNVLQEAVDTCTAESGDIDECEVFKYFPKEVSTDCHIAPRIAEKTTGWMDKLPGCNTIQAGPDRATPQSGCGATTVIGPPQDGSSDMSSKGWSYVGCAIDKLDDRTFPISTSASDMTIEKCIDYCVGKGQVYAGLQYSSECYCGSSAPASDRLGFGRCEMPCAGNSNQICGDAARLSTYKQGGVTTKAVASSSSVAPSSVKSVAPSSTKTVKTAASRTVKTATKTSSIRTTTKTSSTRTATATPSAISIAPAGWTSKGCWVDPVNPRALTTVAYWGEKITTSGCIKYCDSKGFKYAGSEYAGQCYCSSTLDGGSSAPDSECNMACEGNANEICGGSARLSLFEKTTVSRRSTYNRRNFRRHDRM